jgi:chromosome segregation ATPase
MSLPLQYQREIIEKLITEFPILVFKNSNSNKSKKVLDQDQYFSAYFAIIQDQQNTREIEKKIQEFNKQFPLPYDRLMSFQTGRMIVDVDNLISDTYGKVLKLTKQRDVLRKNIKEQQKMIVLLKNKLDNSKKELETITDKYNECQTIKNKVINLSNEQAKKIKSAERKCSAIQKKYNQQVEKLEKERTEINTKIVLEEKDLSKVKTQLDNLNKQIKTYTNEADINLKEELNKNQEKVPTPQKTKKLNKNRKKNKKQKSKKKKTGYLEGFKFW